MASEPRRVAAAAACAVAGWQLHDLLGLVASEQPALALTLLPPALGLLALAVIFGSFAGRWRALGAIFLVLAAVASALPLALPVGVSHARRWLPIAAFLLVLGVAAALALARRAGSPVWRFALAFGALGSLAASWRFEEPGPRPWVVLGASLLLLVAAVSRSAPLRSAATLAALGGPALLALGAGLPHLRLERADLEPGRPGPAAGRRNLLFIVLDTVAADHLQPYGYPVATTPGLDALVRFRGVTFTDVRAPSSWTLPSHATYFTGRLPSEHGADHPRGEANLDTLAGRAPWPARRLGADVPVLAERLRERGFATAGIVANHFFLHHEFGLDRGFERWDDRPGAWMRGHVALAQMAGFRNDLGNHVFRTADTITDRAQAWVRSAPRDRPFFLFLNYMDAHQPYLPPPPFDRAFAPHVPLDPLRPPQELLRLQYDRALAWLDQELTRLLLWLDSEGMLASTDVVITSDHGEAFGEHGLWGHDHALYEEMVRIPLYLLSPTVAPGTSVRPLDGPGIHRLLLTLAGLDLPPRPDGSGPVGEYYRSPERVEQHRRLGLDIDRDLLAWVEGARKTIVASTGRIEVFDLDSDPRERVPLALDPAERVALRARAERWWREHPPRRGSRPAPPDPALVELLNSVGYITR